MQFNKIIKNFSFLAVGKVLGNIFSFLLFVLLSRKFGKEGIGQYSFAMAFTGFFAVFVDFGMQGYFVKELSRSEELAGIYYGRFLSLRLILSALVLGILIILLLFVSFSYEIKMLILLIGIYQIMYKLIDGFNSVFISQEETQYPSILEVVQRGMTTLAAGIIIFLGGSLIFTVGTLPLIAASQIMILYFLICRKYGHPRLKTSFPEMLKLIREAFPYTLLMLFNQVRTRFDVVFLGLFISAAAAGIFNVAYRVIFIFSFLPYFLGLVLLPQASKLYTNSRNDLKVLYNKSLNIAVLLGVPASAGLCLIAPNLITLIYGSGFEESIIILRYLAWLILISLLIGILLTFLIACDKQGEAANCQWKPAVANVIGNLLLIPIIGIKGAAVSTLISESLLAFLYFIQIKKVLGWPQLTSRIAISVTGVTSFCIPFWYFHKISLAVVIPVSVALYFVTLLVFKETRKNELRYLFELLK